MDFTYPLTGLVTIACLLIYIWMAVRIGKARAEHNVPVPLTDGPEGFVRVYRVHANTTEGLILFLPSLWLFALVWGDPWAALAGVFYPLGRLLYARGYYQATDKRGRGFTVGLISTVVLLFGALAGLGIATVRVYL